MSTENTKDIQNRMREAVEYLDSTPLFASKSPPENIKKYLEAFGHPERGMKIIHVAGTNGKGSTCTLIASVLQAAGFRTGLYTSPFVLDFRERIRLNGEMISYSDLDEVTLQVRQAILKLNEEGVFPTEFEAVTAAAFL